MFGLGELATVVFQFSKVESGRAGAPVPSDVEILNAASKMSVIVLGVATTLTVNELLPEELGVPEITPVEALSESPVGREPAEIDQVSGAGQSTLARVTV